MIGLLAGAAGAAPASAAPKPVPCTTSGAHHDCQWRVPGNGTTGGAPVLASNGTRVGYLHQGKNWVLCQRTGRRDKDGSYFNNVWGYTTADNGKKGWVNALWAHGGDNDGAFSGTPQCSASYGSPPGATSTPAPPNKPAPAPTNPAPPATPAPTGGGPAQVPCSSIGKGRHSCNWRVAGNGKSGGTPVLNGAGKRIGYLHQGSNWILCQRTGREESLGGSKNNVWGYTTADNGKKGWANALWARGGANDGGFSGTPQCGAKYGAPPSTGATTAPAPPKAQAPSADSCAHTREGQTATLSYSYYETRQHVILPGNVAQAPATKNDAKPSHHAFGTITVGADACKSPKGWRLGKTVNVREHAKGLYPDSSGKATIIGSGAARGWGLGIIGFNNGSFDVQYTACHETGGGWPIVEAIVTFPLKGLPYKAALAKFGLGKLIPEPGIECENVGTARVTLSADRNGKLVARSQDLTFGETLKRTLDDPHKPGDYHEQTKSPENPKVRVTG